MKRAAVAKRLPEVKIEETTAGDSSDTDMEEIVTSIAAFADAGQKLLKESAHSLKEASGGVPFGGSAVGSDNGVFIDLVSDDDDADSGDRSNHEEKEQIDGIPNKGAVPYCPSSGAKP